MQPAARRPIRAALLGFILMLPGSGPGVLPAGVRPEPPIGTAPPAEAPPPPQAQPEAGEAPESPAPEDAAPEIPPENQSSFLTRIYKMRPGKLWKGLLSTLEAEGFPPEETSQETRTVKTSFVDFSQDKYPAQVAEPPLRLGRNYHILQMIKVKQGKVSLEGVVTHTREGTELRLRARILVMGLDRARRVRILVDRRSTGVIEADVIHRLEERLGIEHL
ncbi:MAG: hypothetical protein HYS34_00690 [Acidobacteria bacterium]|nr:hypothetical protein [Acidobacteriota bacterium]